MRIANTAALLLAMASLVAVAQRSGGRLERKPSPATSAVPAPTGQDGNTSAPVVPAARQMVAPQNFPRPNTNPNIAPVHIQPAPAPPVARPAAAIQAAPTAYPAVAPVAANFAPAPVAAPATMAPAPTPEATATVHYAQGKLSVTSQNAPLGMVLNLISAKTGASIDLAPELQNEPVVAQIGPSAVQDVMSALLDSPKIDYIIMGSGAADGGLQRILVRTRHSFGRTEFAASRPFQPPPAQAPAETEFKLNENVPPVAGVAKPLTPLTQEQLMANWQKAREEKRLAEIEQQRKDRENEANRVEPPPQPEPQAQPETQPNNADNPPLN
ncbi:MAG: hypothetical protein LAO76_11345 [Acidobacteriia bacterium]|nr:hypothetical protein [Terriglobia bacterium]